MIIAVVGRQRNADAVWAHLCELKRRSLATASAASGLTTYRTHPQTTHTHLHLSVPVCVCVCVGVVSTEPDCSFKGNKLPRKRIFDRHRQQCRQNANKFEILQLISV